MLRKDTVREKWKKFALLLRYILRSFLRRMPGSISLVIFIVSLAMFIYLIAFTLFFRPSNLEVKGLVLEEVREQNGQVIPHPLAGVVVEVGGFRTITDSNGFYTLELLSQTRQNIPIIFHRGGEEVVERVSFLVNKNQMTSNYTFK